MIAVTLGGTAERYDGPLDLLLALVRRHDYPLDRLPVAEIGDTSRNGILRTLRADRGRCGQFRA